MHVYQTLGKASAAPVMTHLYKFIMFTKGINLKLFAMIHHNVCETKEDMLSDRNFRMCEYCYIYSYSWLLRNIFGMNTECVYHDSR